MPKRDQLRRSRVYHALRDLLPKGMRMGKASRSALTEAVTAIAVELISGSVTAADGHTLKSAHLMRALEEQGDLATIVQMPYIADKGCAALDPAARACFDQRVRRHHAERRKTKQAIRTLKAFMPKHKSKGEKKSAAKPKKAPQKDSSDDDEPL